MRKFKVIFAPTAARQLKKLPENIRYRLLNAIKKLELNPNLGKILKGELSDYRSYRVGNYRVVYFVRQQKVQIEIIRVAHRREVCSP